MPGYSRNVGFTDFFSVPIIKSHGTGGGGGGENSNKMNGEKVSNILRASLKNLPLHTGGKFLLLLHILGVVIFALSLVLHLTS
jgi:hypothetical protein